VLIDTNKEKAEGECMDLNHGSSFTSPVKIYSAGYEGCGDADIVVITSGARQRPGQTRIDLVRANLEIFKELIPSVMKYAEDAVLLVVTNPVDILTYVTLKISGLPSQRVIGSGTLLDTSRFRYLISEHCEIDPRNIHAYIIGEHGDTELPVWSNASIGGIAISKYCALCNKKDSCDHKNELANIFKEVKDAAYKIIDKKGATYYAVSLALVRIVEAVLRNENSVLPLSTLINDYYGVNNACMSIPCVINSYGVIKFLRLELSLEEQEGFRRSADSLKNVLREIGV
jgi:L-lactate dehydrogenase